MIDSDKKRNFEVKWMEKLVDIDKELEGDLESEDQKRLSRYSRFPVGNNNYLNFI